MYKVLIADDERYVTDGLKLIIDWEKYGFEICASAESGDEALELYEKFKPDFVMFDICMPVHTGVELAEILRSRGYKNDIALLTGYSEIEFARRAVKYKVKYYFNKPINVNEVENALKEIKEELDKKSIFENDYEDEGFVPDEIIFRKISRGESIEGCGAWGVLTVFGCGKKLDAGADENIYRLLKNRRSKTYVIGGADEAECRKKTEKCMELLKDDGVYGVYTIKNTLAEIYDGYTQNLSVNSRLTGKQDGGLYDTKNAAGEDVRLYNILGEADIAILCVKNRDVSELERVIESVIADAAKSDSAGRVIGIFCAYIEAQLLRLISELGINPQEVITEPDFEACESIWEIKDILLKMCNETIKAVKEANPKPDTNFECIEKYLREHFREEIVIKDLAGIFHMNHVYLGVVFSKKAGMSIKNYVHTLRMKEVKRLIRETDESLKDIAYEVGYNNYNNFFVWFERFFGTTPEEYRKNLNK